MLLPLPNSRADEIISHLAVDLDRLERHGDASSWDKASCYLAAFEQLEADARYAGQHGQSRTRKINNDIRAWLIERPHLHSPRVSFFSHSLAIQRTWPEIFGVNPKLISYDHYKRIAVCSLPREQKDQIRQWAEASHPKQAELRARIVAEVDARNGIYKPDFELKVSNFWKFNSHHPNGFDGGVHPLIYANLIYWFTEPGDAVLDPMAGGGVLGYTLNTYRFFREAYEAKGSGSRQAYMSDLTPRSADIVQADASVSLPFDKGVIKLAIIDPPYLRVADRKPYENLGNQVEDWLKGLRAAARNVKDCLRVDGLLAIMTDDVLRKGEHEPIAYLITQMLVELGFEPSATIYNHNPNYVYTMGPAMMKHAREARVQCNGCKIIQVARRA